MGAEVCGLAVQTGDFPALLTLWQTRIERELAARLPEVDAAPTRLHEALRYAVLGGGKRVRPALVYATATALGIPEDSVDGAACAVELIHAYSLVHDDLPAMDDDDLRRGRATCHKAFDEATAILVGDALQVLAFEILANDPALPSDPAVRLTLVSILASASGTLGMAGGQALDLAALGRRLTVAEIEEMHARKTGALILASVMMAAECAHDLNAERRAALEQYARAVGLAFQIQESDRRRRSPVQADLSIDRRGRCRPSAHARIARTRIAVAASRALEHRSARGDVRLARAAPVLIRLLRGRSAALAGARFSAANHEARSCKLART
jgi:Polyprenyl synthetase